MPLIDLGSGRLDYEFYEAKGLDESDIERIAGRLDSACKGGKQHESLPGLWGTALFTSDSEHRDLAVHVYKSPGDVLSMEVTRFMRFRSSPWDRFRSWWPW